MHRFLILFVSMMAALGAAAAQGLDGPLAPVPGPNGTLVITLTAAQVRACVAGGGCHMVPLQALEDALLEAFGAGADQAAEAAKKRTCGRST